MDGFTSNAKAIDATYMLGAWPQKVFFNPATTPATRRKITPDMINLVARHAHTPRTRTNGSSENV
jgi:hypothetical protein